MPSHLVIQSADRLHGTSSDFRVQIPSFSGVGRVALLSASIPNTLYNIYDVNDTIYWSRDGDEYSAEIPDGAYGITDLLVVLGTIMETEDPGATYSAAYSPVTMKVSFISDAADFALLLSARLRAAWDVLGFKSTVDTAGGLIHTGDSVLRLDFPSHLYLDIGLPGADAVNTKFIRSNYIVPMTNISQYVEIYNKAATFSQLQCYSLGQGVSSLQVRLFRPDGTLADLNGADFSFVLGIECPN